MGTKINEHVSGKLVIGVSGEKMQQQLLGERALTMEKALEIAVAIESAIKFSNEMINAQGGWPSKSPTSLHSLTRNMEVLPLWKHQPSCRQMFFQGEKQF